MAQQRSKDESVVSVLPRRPTHCISSAASVVYKRQQYASQYNAELGPPWHNSAARMKVSYPFFHGDLHTAYRRQRLLCIRDSSTRANITRSSDLHGTTAQHG